MTEKRDIAEDRALDNTLRIAFLSALCYDPTEGRRFEPSWNGLHSLVDPQSRNQIPVAHLA